MFLEIAEVCDAIVNGRAIGPGPFIAGRIAVGIKPVIGGSLLKLGKSIGALVEVGVMHPVGINFGEFGGDILNCAADGQVVESVGGRLDIPLEINDFIARDWWSDHRFG
jgi:hypothetical protein